VEAEAAAEEELPDLAVDPAADLAGEQCS
jgi:hypothetical protein